MSDLPVPLTPADCDLQDFEFMPVMVRRLLKSETWSLGTGDERAAAVALWFESWHQVPAASLPSDDRLLKRLADSDKWGKVKAQALRGWVLCADGRMYHPVVAEKALESWIEKLLAGIAGANGNAKRWNLTINVAAAMLQLQGAIGMLRDLAPQSRTLKKKAVVAAVAGIAPGSPPDPKAPSPPDGSSASPPESGSDRNRQGQGQGQGSSSAPNGAAGDAGKPARTPEQMRKSELWRAIKTMLVDSGEAKDLKAAGAIVTQAINRYDEPTALAAIEATLHKRPAGIVAYLEGACQQATGLRLNKQEALEASNDDVVQRLLAKETAHG